MDDENEWEEKLWYARNPFRVKVATGIGVSAE